ncbi:hypothetical protein BJ912DRAFT_928946 [Pholiota molesta]|nr:hypothetical protein BJ912DRAFT_928946 [Pholiota molesta]
MSTARITMKSKVIIRMKVLAAAFVVTGITYGIIAAILCNDDVNRKDPELCLCYLPIPLVICALITDAVVDVSMVSLNWYIIIVSGKHRFPAKPMRKWLVMFAFSSCIFTLISSMHCPRQSFTLLNPFELSAAALFRS